MDICTINIRLLPDLTSCLPDGFTLNIFAISLVNLLVWLTLEETPSSTPFTPNNQQYWQSINSHNLFNYFVQI